MPELWTGTPHMAFHYSDRDIGRASFELGDSPVLAIFRSACD